MGAYAVSRSTTVIADPARVHGFINDFHEWTAWSPWEDIDPDLKRDFLKPFKASNAVRFTLTPAVDGTEVTWHMAGQQSGLMALFGRFVPMDKLVGKDFEKGLTRLKAVAEQPA